MTNRAWSLLGVFFALLFAVALGGCSLHEDTAASIGGDEGIAVATPFCVDATVAMNLEQLVIRLNAEERLPQYTFTEIPGGLGGCAENNFGNEVPVTQHLIWHRVDYDPVAEQFTAAALSAPSDNP